MGVSIDGMLCTSACHGEFELWTQQDRGFHLRFQNVLDLIYIHSKGDRITMVNSTWVSNETAQFEK